MGWRRAGEIGRGREGEGVEKWETRRLGKEEKVRAEKVGREEVEKRDRRKWREGDGWRRKVVSNRSRGGWRRGAENGLEK